MIHIKNILQLLGLADYNNTFDNNLYQRAAAIVLNDTNFSFQSYRPHALRPILDTIKNKHSERFHKLKELNIRIEMPDMSMPDADEYLISAKSKLKKYNDSELLVGIEKLFSCLAVNSKYYDIALFDFIRLSSAIASCFEKGSDSLRLVAVSVSGIQTFLYDIVSKNAVKLLKGRSFYLQLLVDSIQRSCTDEFSASSCNIIYASGGGFYMFVNGDNETELRFQRLFRDISDKIYKKHGTTLFVEMAITESFNIGADVKKIWDELFSKLNQLKNKRLSNIPSLLSDFLNPIEFGGSRDRDTITNIEFSESDRKVQLEDGALVHEITEQQINLGRDLRKAQYWIQSKESLKGLRHTIQDPLGIYHYLTEHIPSIQLDKSIIYSINDSSYQMPFVLYGGNKFPVYSEKTIDENGQIHYEGEIKAFDKLSGDADLKKLAILRMDVDGLGAVFSDQVDGSAYLTNWARYATLSKSLDLFFKGYLNVIQEEVELSLGSKDSSVIIYSGGDDLFIVGRWDTVLEMSQHIKKRFSIWSNGNLTLSGGIELLPAKFPIMQAARMTANAEEKAKEHICGIQKKNAICFLGAALNWDLEFSIVKELHDEILPLLSAKKISKSFLSKIDVHANRQDHYLENNDKVAPKWRWLMAYDMSRYVASIKDEEVKKILNKYVTYAFTDSYKNGPLSALKTKYSFLKLLQIACRWVELKYRTNNIE